MKICFFLQRRFAYVGHAMIRLLKERYDVADFCGYVNLRSSYNFLRSQKDIPYTKLLLEEDIYASYKDEPLDLEYIHALEKEYGLPNMWPYLNMDRVLRYSLLVRGFPSDTPMYTHEDLLRILQVTAQTIEHFLDEEKPDVVFFSVISNLSSMLLFHMAKKRGIKTWLMYCPRVGNKQALSSGYDTFLDLEEVYTAIANTPNDPEHARYISDAQTYLKSFQEQPTYFVESSASRGRYANSVALRRSHLAFIMPKTMGRSIRWFFRMNYEYWKNPHRDDYTTIKPWHFVIDKIKSKYRVLRGAADLYGAPTPDEAYAFFALHTEPEALPMILAPFYMDQAWLIKQVAKSLPVDFKLYVKDHPMMIGRRPGSFYEEIKKIPNVKLIDPVTKSFSLIDKARLVFTITGTAGWEAALLKKPVIIFSKVFYSRLSMVKNCRSMPELPTLVQDQLTNFTYDEEELVHFIAAILQESIDIDLLQIWDIEGGAHASDTKRKELVPLVDLFAKKIGLELKNKKYG